VLSQPAPTAKSAGTSYQIGNAASSPSSSGTKIRAEWLWENVVKWISFVEECLFRLPPSNESLVSSSKWKDMRARIKRPPNDGLPISRSKSMSSTIEMMSRGEKSKARESDQPEELMPPKGKEKPDVDIKRGKKDNPRNRASLDFVSSHFLLPIFHSSTEERSLGSAQTFPSLGRENKKVVRTLKRGAKPSASLKEDRPTRENLKWVDFHFAQRLLNLIDDLLLLPVSTASAPAAPVKHILSL